MTIIEDFDFLCIGSRAAGKRAPVQLAKTGLQVGMIEKHGVVGGSCINSGTIPSKTFRETVLSLKPAKRGREFLGPHLGSPPTV